MNRYARLIVLGMTIALGGSAESQAPPQSSGLMGYVLSSSDRPVSGGTVTARVAGTEAVANIDRSGRFHLDTRLAGSYDLDISSPGFTSLSLRVVMPASRSLVLPPVRLTPPVYARVRLVSPGGEPLIGLPVMRSSFQMNGTPINDRGIDPRPLADSRDGTTLVGPLPRGMTMLAVDVAHLARTRLRDVRVTGETPIVDVGTAVVGRGATLTALVVNRNGEPVQGHDVLLDDGTLLGPIRIPPAKTDIEGKVRFDRLAPGAYRLRMRGLERCPMWYPIVQRLVRVGLGEVHERVVLDTVNLTLRFAFGGTPVSVLGVTIKPESSPLAMPTWLRDADPYLAFRRRSPFELDDVACEGNADRVNSFTFVNVPSGDAQVNAVVGGSRWTRKIKVPSTGGEIVVQPHDGIAPLRVIAADDRAPVVGAVVTWKSSGTEVEAASQANGEVLLQGISVGAGNMTVRSQGFQALTRDFVVPPDVLHEIPLERISRAAWGCRVLDDGGKPITGAVVQLIPNDRLEQPVVITTDAGGVARFVDLRVGAARVVTMAAGYATSIESIKLAAASGDANVVLERGYRVLVDAPADAPPDGFAVRVVNARGGSVDALLDAASDRQLSRSGRASIGPLAAGTYIVELHGLREPLRQEIHLVDRDGRTGFSDAPRQNP